MGDFRERIVSLRVLAFCVLAITTTSSPALADKIDDLISDLQNDSDRVRISAVLALTSQESPRAITGLARRLGDRGEKKNVRGLAATALGRIVQNGRPKPSAAQKKIAIDALQRAKSDPEPFVSAKAEAALEQLGSSVTPTRGGGGPMRGVYVNVGPMSSKTTSNQNAKFRASMEKTARTTLSRVAPTYQQSWAGGGVPNKQQLQQKKIAGFYVDGTLNSVTVTKSGNTATISCKVNMLLADFPDRSVFGFLNGGANVQGSASANDIALGTQDCIQAVVEDLITKKIVPTIKTKI